MLVLSRKNGESIKIGEDIEIQVLQSQGNRVRLGIKAPKSVSIQRTELCERLSLRIPSPDPSSQIEVATAM